MWLFTRGYIVITWDDMTIMTHFVRLVSASPRHRLRSLHFRTPCMTLVLIRTVTSKIVPQGPGGFNPLLPNLGGHPSGVEPTFEAVPRGCMFYRSFQPSTYPGFVVCFFWCTVPAAGWWFTSSSFDTFCFFSRIETTMQATLQ